MSDKGDAHVKMPRLSNWLRLPMASAVAFSLAACVIAAATSENGLPLWASALIVTALAASLFVRIRGRVILPEWVGAVWNFWRSRRGTPLHGDLPAAVDIDVLSGTAGVRRDGYTLVSAIEVGPSLELVREHGRRVTATSTLSLALVADLMRHYGFTVDIDVVSSGRHVPAGSSYRTVYSQFVGPRPIVAQRRTWLVLRLNMFDNLAVIADRGPSARSAPKMLASATHRVVQRLQQERVRAYALSAAQLNEFADLVLAPVTVSADRERWATVESGPNFITTYGVDPELISDELIDHWWSWRTEDALTVLRLSRNPAGQVRVGALVRYVTHGKAELPLAETRLRPLTGVQRNLIAAALPAGDRSLVVSVPTVGLEQLDDVALPIGPSGQILGRIGDTTVAAPLWDQCDQPQRRRVEMRASAAIVGQQILRAVTAGAVVAVYTDARERWDPLLAAVNDPSRLFYATAGARDCDIAVFDDRKVTTVPARTIVRVARPTDAAAAADLTLVEGVGQELEVSVSEDDSTVMDIIRFREEDRYLGIAEAPAAPRRSVSTAPAVARAPRSAPAQPGRVPVPAAGGGGSRRGSAVPATRHHDIAGPQRQPRVERPAAPSAPAPRRRRDFQLPEASENRAAPRRPAEPGPGEGGDPAGRPRPRHRFD